MAYLLFVGRVYALCSALFFFTEYAMLFDLNGVRAIAYAMLRKPCADVLKAVLKPTLYFTLYTSQPAPVCVLPYESGAALGLIRHTLYIIRYTCMRYTLRRRCCRRPHAVCIILCSVFFVLRALSSMKAALQSTMYLYD